MVLPNRLTSVHNVTTSAKTVDNNYNFQAAEYGIVSADGVLFCVPAKLLAQIDALWDMTRIAHGAQDTTTAEIPLSDNDFENAAAIRCLLDLLSMEGFDRKHSSYPVGADSVKIFCDTLQLADKYGAKRVLSIIKVFLERFCDLHVCPNFFPVFAIAARLDDEELAGFAAWHLLESHDIYRWETHLAASIINNTSVEYLWALHILTHSYNANWTKAKYVTQFKKYLRHIKDEVKKTSSTQ